MPNTAAAAEAYDRGSAFYLNEDYGRAARWFETAYRLAPSVPALVQALRSQVHARHPLRAANLALRLRGLHGDDEEASAFADEVIAENGPDLVHLVVECDGCRLEIDGRVWSYREAMLAPSLEHAVRVSLGERSEAHRVRGEPGQLIFLGAPRESPTVGEGPEPPPPVTGGSRGLPPWVFGVTLGLTLAAGAILVWSGIDTLDGVDAFNRMPTVPAFEAGQARELRTNILIGMTTALGLATLLFAILADWDGDPPPTRVGAFFDGTSAGVWMSAAF